MTTDLDLTNHGSRRHHFVPEGYLKRFSLPRDGPNIPFEVYEYRKSLGFGGKDIPPVKRAIKQVGFRDYMNTMKFVSYNFQSKRVIQANTDILERAFSEIENEAEQAIAQFSSRPNSLSEGSIYRRLFSYYFGFLYSRSPKFIDYNIDVSRKIAEDIAEGLRFDNDVTIALQGLGASPTLDAGNRTAKRIFSRRWCIYHAPERVSFITSDNPVFCTGASRPWEPNAEVFFPVSKKLAIHTKRELKKDNIVQANPKIVKLLNTMIIHQAVDRVYASFCNHKLAGLVAKSRR